MNPERLHARKLEPGETIIKMADPKSLQFVAPIDEREVSKVASGQDVLVRLDAFPYYVYRAFHGVVAEVSLAGREGGRGDRVSRSRHLEGARRRPASQRRHQATKPTARLVRRGDNHSQSRHRYRLFPISQSRERSTSEELDRLLMISLVRGLVRGDLKRFIGLFAPYKNYVTGIVVLEFLVTLTNRLEPLFLLVFVNEVTVKTNLNMLLALVVTMVACAVSNYYLYGVAKYHRARLGQRKSLADLRRSLFARLLEQPPPFFESHAPGRLLALGTAEIDALDGITDALFGVQTVFAIVFIFGVCLAIDAQLALLLLVPLPVMGLLLALDRRMRARNSVALDKQSRLVSFLKQRLSNVITTQAFGREKSDNGLFGEMADELVEARARTEVLVQISLRILELTQVVVLAMILLAGGMRFVHRQNISLGAITAIFAYAISLFLEGCHIYHYVVRARLATVAFRRLFELLDAAPPVRDERGARELPVVKGRVVFDRVWFKYPTSTQWVLRDVSFDVKPGQFVAIVGLSGSGKSTLFRLLLRFYNANRGTVAIDGLDIRMVRLSSVRSQIALALQDAVIFDGTIADNIGYGRARAARRDVVAAARVAMAHDFIDRLPLGYDTIIGEGGADLSGGERQRIALARVVLKDAPVLLMDEVTSGLDAKTESDLGAALSAVTHDRTTICVSHRLTTVVNADRIIVMDQGRVVQQGKHAELYKQSGGLYRVLFDRQFNNPLESAAPNQAVPPALEAVSDFEAGLRHDSMPYDSAAAGSTVATYFFASAASFSRYFFVISSCSCFGTTAYLANSMVNVPLPCVAERRSVE